MSKERDEELLAARAEIKISRDKAERQNWRKYHLAQELDTATQELEIISELLLKASVLIGLAGFGHKLFLGHLDLGNKCFQSKAIYFANQTPRLNLRANLTLP